MVEINVDNQVEVYGSNRRFGLKVRNGDRSFSFWRGKVVK